MKTRRGCQLLPSLTRRQLAGHGRAWRALFALSLVLALVVILCTPYGARAGEPGTVKSDIALGRRVYQRECALCHGAAGKGDGLAARFLDPKPRDFTRGIFKFRSTLTLPTDDDLFRIITQGMPGTLMPSFAYLPEEERWSVVAYIKTFIPASLMGQALEPVPIPEPPHQTPALLAKGQALFQRVGCASCHGTSGNGDGPLAAKLMDQWGQRIMPRDFTTGEMKGGSTPKDIYRPHFGYTDPRRGDVG